MNRESNAIRASVFDAFVQLGAFNDHSMVGQWIFSDGEEDVVDPSKDRNKRHERPVNFRPTGVDRTDSATAWENRDIEPSDAPTGSNISSPSTKRAHLSLPFRPMSLSKNKRRRTPTSSGYETDEGYKSSGSTPRTKGGQEVHSLGSSSAQVSSQTPSTVFPPSKTSPKPLAARAKSLLRSRRRSKAGKDTGNKQDVDEGWLEISALTPTLADQPPVQPEPYLKSTAQHPLDHDRNRHAPGSRFSFATPRGLIQSFSVKRGISQKPLFLAPIDNRLGPPPPSAELERVPHSRGGSISLPPSPFVLITARDGSEDVRRNPFIIIPSPSRQRRISDTTIAATPIFPLSVAKTLRRSLLVDASSELPLPSISTTSLPEIASTPSTTVSRFPSIQRGREHPFPLRPIRRFRASTSTWKSSTRAPVDGSERSVPRQRYREDTHDDLDYFDRATCARCGRSVDLDCLEEHICAAGAILR